MHTKPDAVGKHHARWKDRIPNEFSEAPRILTRPPLRRSDSTKLVQNDPDFMHFGAILALQPGLEWAEMCGSQIWKVKSTPGQRPFFLSAVVEQGRPQELIKGQKPIWWPYEDQSFAVNSLARHTE